ncbi:MAG: thiamine pyrophosphate-binding protein [Cyanobacteriota bacterium]|nr:thiamine pyrophosphate-binding protein [Cyanobacteriota bacterium]
MAYTGGDLIRDFLDLQEIPYVFGNPGTTETTFLDAVGRSKAQYLLALHESTAVGLAAGYAMATRKPALVSLHTYPGLANGLFNMRNALLSGVPLLVINGQQDSRFLIHSPVLGAPNAQLAETATKYSLEVTQAEDLPIALQRCWLQARLQPSGPVFLSVPMNFMQEPMAEVGLRRTTVLDDVVPAGLSQLAEALQAPDGGRVAIVADYAVGASDAVTHLSQLASRLEADVYSAPFHVQGVVDPLHPRYKGQLPATTREIRKVLSGYGRLLLLGEKIDTFTFNGVPAIPADLKIYHLAPATRQLGFDYPCDLAVLGDVGACLNVLVDQLGAPAITPCQHDGAAVLAKLQAEYPREGTHASDALILDVLTHLPRDCHLVTEGSSEDALVQRMAIALGFGNVHFAPRGGGLGWAMPLGVGLALGSGQPSVCFVGDGGAQFSIHAIWSAARYRIPVVFVCFVNREYRILKNLWCGALNTSFEEARFVGLDFNDPALDLESIARGYGARTGWLHDASTTQQEIQASLHHDGPSFLLIERET